MSARDLLDALEEESDREEFQFEDPIGPVQEDETPWYEIDE